MNVSAPVTVDRGTNLWLLVHNKLVSTVNEQAEAGAFCQYRFGEDRCAYLTEEAVTPSSVLAGDTSGTYGMSQNKQERFLERVDWFWQLQVTFPTHVDLEPFKATLENALEVPRNADGKGSPTIWLDALEFNCVPPVQEQGSSQGTQALFRFDARITRK